MKNKVKKLIPYFLTLIILAGMWIPVTTVEAQAAKGCFDKSFFYTPSVKNEPDCVSKGFSWLTSAEAAAAVASSRQTNPLQKHCYDTGGFGTGATTEADCLKTTGNVWRTAGGQA